MPAVIELTGAGMGTLTGQKNMQSPKKSSVLRVNVCWEINKERQCKTMTKDEAYALKAWLDENNGFTYWFQALDD
tara:strand:- start:260 stop:484 length:225 start_codon:yes stop_codon:yes gene_type:complete